MNDDDRLLALAAERGYYNPRCQHANATLCQHEHKTFGWFAVYQCDDCGLLLNRQVPREFIEDGNGLPFMDVARAEFATDAVVKADMGIKEETTMNFFNRAIMGR